MAISFAPLPSLPRSNRRNKPVVPCACGCGGGTKSRWVPGHDGRATGWAVRIERGLLTIDEVPENERPGAVIMVRERAERNARAARKEA